MHPRRSVDVEAAGGWRVAPSVVFVAALTMGIMMGSVGCASTGTRPGAEPIERGSGAQDESASALSEAPTTFELITDVDTIPETTVTFEMILLPGGTVTIEGENGPEMVEVGPFWIQKTETTWDEFDVYALGLDLKTEQDRFEDVVIRPSKPYGAPDRGFGHTGYAAISMTHHVAHEYARWLSHKTGKSYRLPTAAEWHYACMAGAETDPGLDEAELAEKAWYWDNAFDKTWPVGSLEPNPFGLHDMMGNVMEWCVADEETPTACGGSYNDKAERVFCGARAQQTPRWQDTDPQIPKSVFWLTDAPFVGFRVVRDP